MSVILRVSYLRKECDIQEVSYNLVVYIQISKTHQTFCLRKYKLSIDGDGINSQPPSAILLTSFSITQSLNLLSTFEIGKANVAFSLVTIEGDGTIVLAEYVFNTRVRVGNEHVLKMSSFVRPSLNATSMKDDFERG